ncbi:MAG TPA: WalW protein [Planctomycetota bacterium]|nr:WalW protein [Planctomycetota bacterium]
MATAAARPALTTAAGRLAAGGSPARLPEGHPPVLTVVLDAEEEFEWEAEFVRGTTAVSAMAYVERAQAVFDEYGITPTYVVTYPVATQPEGSRPLAEIARSGRACIGAHLHPWVTPPFEEPLCRRNSFPGNLPPGLERAKLRATAEAIAEHIGTRPLVYQAGRYGYGANTAAALAAEGFLVDCSILPTFDYRHEEGPDFTGNGPEASWIAGDAGSDHRILSLPLTASWVGFLHGSGAGLYRWATHPWLQWARLPGALSRIGALERLRLSPEGYSTENHRCLTSSLLARGQRTFTFSFHTPSLKPGCTPYVRSAADLDEFLDRCRRYFEYFLGEVGGVCLTPLQLRERMLAS